MPCPLDTLSIIVLNSLIIFCNIVKIRQCIISNYNEETRTNLYHFVFGDLPYLVIFNSILQTVIMFYKFKSKFDIYKIMLYHIIDKDYAFYNRWNNYFVYFTINQSFPHVLHKLHLYYEPQNNVNVHVCNIKTQCVIFMSCSSELCKFILDTLV